MERAVDFFVVGTQKGGTTALDSMLRGHPSIQMASVKEVHFFDDDSQDWNAPKYAGLHDHFDWGGGSVVRGEATPIYTYWPSSIERLAAYNPDAKLIMGLRHPGFRAHSHWAMETTRQAETASFSDAIRSGRRRVEQAKDGVHRVFSYVERGFYDAQVEKLLRHFHRDRVHFFRTDHLWLDPRSTIRQIEAFLNIEARLTPPQRYVVPLPNTVYGGMSAADRHFLDEVYQASIQSTERLTSLDLTDWKTPTYSEPMRAS